MEFKEKVSYKEFFEASQEIYNSLEDDESKDLFKKRMEISSVGLPNLEMELVRFSSPYWDEPQHLELFNNLCEIFGSISDEEIVIYGAGALAKNILILFNINIQRCPNVVCCDKNYESKLFIRFPLISPDELLKKHRNKKIIITTFDYHQEAYDFLVENGIDAKNIIRGVQHEIQHRFLLEYEKYCDLVYKVFVDTKIPNKHFISTYDMENQYFDDIITYGENEVFVDAGVFDGNTSFLFAERCPNYKKIYLFEPDSDCYQTSIKNIQDRELNNTEIFNVGLFNEKTTLSFSQTQDTPSGHRIVENGETSVEVNTLDNFFIHNPNGNLLPPTFIKMDIEGAELAALGGGVLTIRKYKPKLAISIYHKPEDIIEILSYIKSLVPEYKFYIRHYSLNLYETVLYAIIE